jgi:hypothetical protein
MKKSACWGILSVFFVCLNSCSKDNNNTGSSALNGSWTFNGFHAKTLSSAQDTEAGIVFKTVTTSDYTTTNNAGTVNISGTTMTGTGVAYSADLGIFVTDYEDGAITDTFSTSLPVTIPPTNSTTTFEVIGSDSIHFTSASLLGSAGNGSPASNGARFSVAGDLLTLTSNVIVDRVIDTLGTVITQHETATVVTTLKKQ